MQPTMFLDERHALIRMRLVTAGRVVAADLAAELNISEDTVRRDLRTLAAAGVCRRVYGGAVALTVSRSEAPAQAEDWRPLAKAAASCLTPRTLVFVDAGPISTVMVEQLPKNLEINFATNSPTLALSLTARLQARPVLIGGFLSPTDFACYGQISLDAISHLRPGLAILTNCSVDPEAGITVFGEEEAALKKAVLACSKRVIAVCPNQRLGQIAPFFVAAQRELHVVVVESDAAAGLTRTFSEMGAEVIRALAKTTSGVHSRAD